MTPSTVAPPVRGKPVLAPMRLTTSFELMRHFGDEMGRMFGELGIGRPWPPFALFAPTREELTWIPNIEVEQPDGKLFVRADLPGLTKSDVKVEIADEVLTIEGERKHEEKKKTEGYYRSERSYGRFCRSIALPERTKADTAKATFKDGVLEIVLEVAVRNVPIPRVVEIEEAPKNPVV
jgi:HSP20 family protein